MFIKFNRQLCLLLITLFTILVLTSGCDLFGGGGSTVKVGVMLTVSGSGDYGAKIPLEWAKENINAAGGIDGKNIELVYSDLATKDYNEAADEFIENDDIVAVIGADTSTATFDVAPKFIRAKKVLITPSATAAEITRAFGGKKYLWRTVESDIGQVRTMLMQVARKGFTKVALLTGEDVYGGTFFDWFGFFATELRMDITKIVQYDQFENECDEYMQKALESNPEVLLAVPTTPETAVCIVKKHKESGSKAQLLFSDGATYSYIVEQLGEDAEGMEGLTISSDIRSGFDIAYNIHFGEYPGPYGANVYDALSLVAYGLQHGATSGESDLANSLEAIVSARGEVHGWDKQGIQNNLEAIKSGLLPDVTGGSGELVYDNKIFTDLVSSTYALWRVEGGKYVAIEYISSDDSENPRSQSGVSLFNTLASDAARQNLDNITSTYEPVEKEGLWAMVVATSEGWGNYRHQADALAVYNMLKANGLPDDRIIFIMADDLAKNEENPIPGQVRNEPGGKNLYEDVEIDYKLEDVEPEDYYNILSGKATEEFPEVIKSTATDNIYMFIVGHGNDTGVRFRDDWLISQYLNAALEDMYENNLYRQVLIEIEACHSGTMGSSLTTPGVVLLTAANPYENSFGANYDGEIHVWLADQFAYGFYQIATGEENISLRDVYEKLYVRVNGSHVNIYNSANFGDVNDTYLSEFIYP